MLDSTTLVGWMACTMLSKYIEANKHKPDLKDAVHFVRVAQEIHNQAMLINPLTQPPIKATKKAKKGTR